MSREASDVLKRAASIPQRGADVTAAMRRGATLKKRRYAYIAGAALLVVGALSVGVTALSRNTGPPLPPSAKIHRSGFVVYRGPNNNFSIRYPSTWYRAHRSLTPHLTFPHELFSIGTRLPQYRPTNCAQLPKSALQDLSNGDAFISIEESGGTHGFPARPADFQTNAHPIAMECVPRGAPLNVYWLRFRDSGRGFYALVAIGKDASGRVKAQTWAALNSFSTTDKPYKPGICVVCTRSVRIPART